jgi:hypothetical protein
VDDAAVSALEEVVGDLGSLLVEMQKFRAARAPDAQALRRACLGLGDRARRAHRHGTLDPAVAADLGADAAVARSGLQSWLAALRSSPPYTAAVAALAAGDDARLRAALVTLFEGAVSAPRPATLFHAVAWQRRGRPRPAAEIADDLVRLRTEGLAGDGDPGAPGVDPALPGVVFSVAPPPGQPIYLAIGGGRPDWVLALPDGNVVVPGARLQVECTVVLADPGDPDLDEWTMDPVALRDGLERTLAARGLPVSRR